MILVDANLLIYAATPSAPHHRSALAWLDNQLNGNDPVGMPWGTLLAFLRIMTNPRIVSPPFSMTEAWEQVAEWLNVSSVWIPGPTQNHASIFGRLLKAAGADSNLVPDVHLAALAIRAWPDAMLR